MSVFNTTVIQTSPYPNLYKAYLRKMKRRVTYITAPDAPFDPAKQGILSNNNLAIRELDAAKEERFTFALEELPTDVSIHFSSYCQRKKNKKGNVHHCIHS